MNVLNIVDVDTPEKTIEFCNYLQSIVNSCSGFIKTKGDFYHVMNAVIMSSEDRCFLSIVDIPISYNFRLTGKCGALLSIKDDQIKSNVSKYLNYYGATTRGNELLNLYNEYYNNLSIYEMVYHEENAYNIPGFENAVSKTDLSLIPVVDKYGIMHMINSSKSITPLNKSDTCSVSIYKKTDTIYTVEYRIFKKKFKLYMSIYFNIIKLYH